MDMTRNTNNYCVILAGGKGRRLWPCSREEKPKQFIDFFGTGRTQLQQTFDRFAKVVPEANIYVVTNAAYAQLVREQLPQLSADNLLAEPIHRNTAPSTVWATHRIAHRNPLANVAITPSDQAVQNEEAFLRDMAEGFAFVSERRCLLTMGVKPSRPEPGYGYIQTGEPASGDVFSVQSFTEKPEREFARMFMESGEFLWNTGIFLGSASYLWEQISQLLPSVLRNFNDDDHYSVEAENAYIRENFPAYPNLSLDYAILERSDNVFVMQGDFGWADLGTWHSIYETMRKGEGDNVAIDSDTLFDNAHGNIVKLPKDRVAVIQGLDGYIVAEEGNVLLICRKEDSSALVRKFVNEMQLKKGNGYV